MVRSKETKNTIIFKRKWYFYKTDLCIYVWVSYIYSMLLKHTLNYNTVWQNVVSFQAVFCIEKSKILLQYIKHDHLYGAAQRQVEMALILV